MFVLTELTYLTQRQLTGQVLLHACGLILSFIYRIASELTSVYLVFTKFWVRLHTSMCLQFCNLLPGTVHLERAYVNMFTLFLNFSKFQSLQSLSWLCCTTDEHDPSLPRIEFHFNVVYSVGYITGFHETVFSKGRLTLHNIDYAVFPSWIVSTYAYSLPFHSHASSFAIAWTHCTYVLVATWQLLPRLPFNYTLHHTCWKAGHCVSSLELFGPW